MYYVDSKRIFGSNAPHLGESDSQSGSTSMAFVSNDAQFVGGFP